MDIGRDHTLRIATAEDDITDLLLEAIEESPYSDFGFSASEIEKTVEAFVSSPSDRIILLLCHQGTPIGLLAGVITPNVMRPSWKVATEAIWYVSPEHRGKYSLWLLDAYEFWARKMGAKIISTANFGSKAIDKLYRKRGYALVEHSFIKVLD